MFSSTRVLGLLALLSPAALAARMEHLSGKQYEDKCTYTTWVGETTNESPLADDCMKIAKPFADAHQGWFCKPSLHFSLPFTFFFFLFFFFFVCVCVCPFSPFYSFYLSCRRPRADTHGATVTDASPKTFQLVGWYGTCAFGVRPVTKGGNTNFFFGSTDAYDLIFDGTMRFRNMRSGKIGASGVAHCGDTQVNWGIFHRP